MLPSRSDDRPEKEHANSGSEEKQREKMEADESARDADKHIGEVGSTPTGDLA